MKAKPGQRCCVYCGEAVPEILTVLILNSGWDFKAEGWVCPGCNKTKKGDN